MFHFLKIFYFPDCKAVYLINRRADSVEKLIFDTDKNGAQPDREVAGEDVISVMWSWVGFEDFYETLKKCGTFLSS